MRQNLHRLFGFKMGDDESFTAYLARMDKLGQLDLLKLIKVIGWMLDVREKGEEEKKTGV